MDRISILMTYQYPDLGSASDWMKQLSNAVLVTNQKHYPDLGSDVSSFLRRHFIGKLVVSDSLSV